MSGPLGGVGRAEAELAAALAADAWERVADGPAAITLAPGEADAYEGALPRHGVGAEATLRRIAEQVLPRTAGHTHPRAFHFVDGSALEVGVLADLLAGTRDANMASGTGAASAVEQQAWRWIAELIGYPASGGVFTSGGTMANLTALAAARDRAVPGAREHGVPVGRVALYRSTEAHHSADRACDLLGLGTGCIRAIAVDERLRLRPEALADALAADRAAGVRPLAVWASAGTTSTGAVDPFDAIADVCAEHGAWLHIDGAYGAPAACAPSTAELFAGLARADSLSLDPHKWLYAHKACGCLLVRDPSALREAFSDDIDYLENVGDGPLGAPSTWPLFSSPEFSRPWRGLRVWAALLAHGADAFVAAIEHDLACARAVADAVRAAPEFELLDEPQLSTVVFRHRPAGVDEPAALDAHNRSLLDRLQRDGRVFLSGTQVRGAFALRPCFISHRTTIDDALACVEVARHVASTA